MAAGLGRREEAYRTFKQVRKDYEAGSNALGAAVVSLEIAVLCLEEGRTAEVRKLADSMVRIFAAEGDEPEELIAVRLFAEAALRETVTVEEVRRLQAALEKLADLKVRTMT